MQIEGLRDIEVFEAIPAESRWRGANTFDLIERSARTHGARPALKFQRTAGLDEQPETVTYTSLLDGVTRAANALHAGGVSSGGVTSILLPNLPETHFASWGAQALGIVSPINFLLEGSAIRDIIVEAGAQAVVALGPGGSEDTWDKCLAEFDAIPSLKLILQVNVDERSASLDRTPGGIPIVDFAAACAAQSGEGLAFDREIKANDIGAYFHTGGTTGLPKLAQLTHANQVHVASMMVDFRELNENSVTFGGLPLYHVNAFFNAGLTIFAAGGHAVYLTPRGFRNKAVMANYWRFVEKYRPTYLMAVPTMVSGLLESLTPDRDLTSIDFVICGAAPISPALFQRFQDETAVPIIEGYGLTEGTVSSSSNPQHGEKRVGSIGLRAPYQEMKCVLLDEEGRYVRDSEVDEPGVIVIRGPNVFAGYKQPEKNKEAFVDDWFITGDLARQDAEGYFWMTGRAKDLIIRGGHNIDPKTIEDAYAAHPDLEHIAAVGQPDVYAGELPCLYVTVKSGQDAPSQQDLLDYGRSRIGERAALPAHAEVIDTMPLTAVGKIFKPTLREVAAARVAKRSLEAFELSVDVYARHDPARGLTVYVKLVGGEIGKVREVMGQFALAYEIED